MRFNLWAALSVLLAVLPLGLLFFGLELDTLMVLTAVSETLAFVFGIFSALWVLQPPTRPSRRRDSSGRG